MAERIQLQYLRIYSTDRDAEKRQRKKERNQKNESNDKCLIQFCTYCGNLSFS